jgi:GT2 family glycosyltransferase
MGELQLTGIAIVIVTWNKLLGLQLLLEDIQQLQTTNDSLDIYVIDNASTDGTSDWLRDSKANVKVIRTVQNCGGSGGFSLGLKTASELDYSYIWLLDDDVRLETNALVELVAVLDNQPSIGIVGSQIRKLNNPEFIQEMGSKIYPKKAHLLGCFANQPLNNLKLNYQIGSWINVDVVAAASLLIRAELVRTMGYFENYFLHFDDVEWCLRAVQYGANVAVAPLSIVWHDSPDHKVRPWISYYDERNLCYCFEKHRPELLLKRLRVVFPKLLYYSLTGRQFWVEAYLNGYHDFLSGIQGQMPADRLTYQELDLNQVIQPGVVVVMQAEVAESLPSSVLTSSKDQQVFSGPVLRQLADCFNFKRQTQADYALISCQRPFWPLASLSPLVYFYTGSGFIPGSVTLVESVKNSFKTGWQLTALYWAFLRRQFTSK